MDSTSRQSWFRVVVFIGALYALVGITFALPASHARAWRLAAWMVSGAVYVVHLGFERFRLRNSSLISALRAALAAALGALGLAVGAIIHSFSVRSPAQHQRLLLVALLAWPVITGVPAFLVGLGVSGLLANWSRRARVGP
jgi:hypothetical protein